MIQAWPISTHALPPRRYPPFAGGLSAAASVRADCAGAETRLRQSLGLPGADHDRRIEPVLARLAALTHALPAGPDHYRHAGGLYQYSLTVASLALRFAEGCLFGQDEAPAERHRQAPCWRLVILYAGLGQALTALIGGLRVQDPAGAVIWNPYQEPLAGWLVRYQWSCYVVRWADAPLAHPRRRLLLLRHLLPPEILPSLGRPAVPTLLACLAGLPNDIQGLIDAAIAAAVAQDREAQASDPAARTATAVTLLLGVLKPLLAKDPPIERTKGRVYLHWAALTEPLLAQLRQTRPPLPLDADLLACLLLQQGVAEPGSCPGWLRLIDPSLILKPSP